jgi:O-succinylbenzoic acid--CoA ligase
MQHLHFQFGAESAPWNDRLALYRQRLLKSPLGKELGSRLGSGVDLALPTVLVVEPDPLDFLAATIVAIEVQAPVILGNPQWSLAEWQALRELQLLDPSQGAQLWGVEPPVPFPAVSQGSRLPAGAILMATGGSGGGLRFAHHTWNTLRAAVEGLQRSNLLPDQPLSSCCLLPLYHVSGFMQFMRSFLTQGELILSSSREILAAFRALDPALDLNRDELSELRAEREAATFLQNWTGGNYYLSLVPTQLHRFLAELPPEGVDWLRRFALIFVGGAALRDDLRDQARSLRLPLAPTYGMTETAGMVATLAPQGFLEGNTSVGRLLPHCQVQFLPTQSDLIEPPPLAPDRLPPLKPEGRITIRSASLALGYYPPDRSLEQGRLLTNDRGWIGADHYLYIAGRLDRVIITGGENVNPEQVEVLLLQTGLLKDVAVIGRPHPEWGEQVVALCVGVADWPQLKTIAQQRLSPPQRPKIWMELEALPRNDRGKLLLSELWNSAQESEVSP